MYRSKRAWISGAIASWCLLSLSSVQGATADSVYVSANPIIESLKDESLSTTVISKADIANKQAKSVEDIIFTETGVSRTVDAMGRVALSIRGAEPRHTLILINGQPVMGEMEAYLGQGDELQRLGAESIDRIEVIRGAASAKYGANAMGGVINVVTIKPTKHSQLEVNVEGRRIQGDHGVLPYKNIFIRANSGNIGKGRVSLYSSKRDIMPIYSQKEFIGAMNQSGSVHNALRYYGDIKELGLHAEYDANANHHFSVQSTHWKEDTNRDIKHSNDAPDPVVHYGRNIERWRHQLTYVGNNQKNLDWKVNLSIYNQKEFDKTISSTAIFSPYEGKNTLHYIDDVKHREWKLNASLNQQVGNHHFLSYRVGYSEENGSGSRLKSAKSIYTRYINPWDFDKNLHSDKGVGEPSSKVYDYALYRDEADIPQYDQAYELYGYKNHQGKAVIPSYTYQDYTNDVEDEDRIHTFAEELRAENESLRTPNEDGDLPDDDIIMRRYYDAKTLKWHGKTFTEEGTSRRNRQTIGTSKIRKANVAISDFWQLNKNTFFTPILRWDNSNLFGNTVTFNLGLTHYVHGNRNYRIKTNVGTAYTEPGMGELYYNWEMYAGMPYDFGVGKLGYYWIGNPNLKPEKSINVDLGFEYDTKRLHSRMMVFHNDIKNYMTTYFTGKLMNFNPDAGKNTWMTPPDMIYSFKNIGKAEITGIEGEIKYALNTNLSTRLGYTYLHARNISDPTMPAQLLNKPVHKIDIGLQYENKKSGWQASLWGDYYIHMLDSNTIANNGNYVHNDLGNGDSQYAFAEKGKQTYESKSFSIWNAMIQKKIGKDSLAYIGVDNIFNYRDDAQAHQERMYKVGLHMKFGADSSESSYQRITRLSQKTSDTPLNWFVRQESIQEPLTFYGSYRGTWSTFTGKEKPSEARVTATSTIGNAYKNYLEKANHGYSSSVQVGVKGTVTKDTSIDVAVEAKSYKGKEQSIDAGTHAGIQSVTVKRLEVKHHKNDWKWSVGRLYEALGTTGYWFNDSYDGVRAIWSSPMTEVRMGYGDFHRSTGITDSAYTHAVKTSFTRPPTKDEWLGQDSFDRAGLTGEYTDGSVHVNNFKTLRDKLEAARTPEEEKAVIDTYMKVIEKDDSKLYEKLHNRSGQYYMNSFIWRKVTVTNTAGQVVGEYMTTDLPQVYTKSASNDTALLEKDATKAWDVTMQVGENKEDWSRYVSNSGLLKDGSYKLHSDFYGYGTYLGNDVLEDLGTTNRGRRYGGIIASKFDASKFVRMTQEEAKAKAITSLWNKDTAWMTLTKKLPNGSRATGFVKSNISPLAKRVLLLLASELWKPENNSSLPLHVLEQEGYRVPIVGNVLVQDTIPSVNKAFFTQLKHQINNHWGVQAWYMRSIQDSTNTLQYANASGNDVYQYNQVANVLGAGLVWKAFDTLTVSADIGQNRTSFGKYLNGETQYTYDNSVITSKGRRIGSYPKFWTIRLDVGHPEQNYVGSWNAYADYKYFEHGSFIGGNGTNALPDRYLDGVQSFTVGGRYTPLQDVNVFASYTFNAKGIHSRDTLYGGEKFDLGDYTKIAVEYKF